MENSEENNVRNILINEYGENKIVETDKGYWVKDVSINGEVSLTADFFVSKDMPSDANIVTYYSGATGDHGVNDLQGAFALNPDDENQIAAIKNYSIKEPIFNINAALNSPDSTYKGIVVVPRRGEGFQGNDGYGFDVANSVLTFEEKLKENIAPNTIFKSITHGWSASDQVSLIQCALDSDSNTLIYFDPKAQDDCLRFPSFAANHQDVISQMAGKKIIAFETTREVYNRQDLPYDSDLTYINNKASESGIVQNGYTLESYKKAFVDKGVDVLVISVNSMHNLYTKVYGDGLFNYISDGELNIAAMYEDGLIKYKDFLHYSKYTRKWENISEDLFNLFIKDDDYSKYKYHLLTLKSLPLISPPESLSNINEAVSIAINKVVANANEVIECIKSSKCINNQLSLINDSTIETPIIEKEYIDKYQKNTVSLLDVIAQDLYATTAIACRKENIDKLLEKVSNGG